MVPLEEMVFEYTKGHDVHSPLLIKRPEGRFVFCPALFIWEARGGGGWLPCMNANSQGLFVIIFRNQSESYAKEVF